MIIIKSIIIIKYEMILRARIDVYPNTCYFRDVVCFYTIRYMKIWVGCKKLGTICDGPHLALNPPEARAILAPLEAAAMTDGSSMTIGIKQSR